MKTAHTIEQWPVTRLVPYDRNARTHSEAQVAQIAASITQFGFNNPILVDSSSGIIAGHGRLQAARKLGLASVPVIVLDHLTDAQRRAYILADNKLALNAGWDEELLLAELRDLDEMIDLQFTGFDANELERLFATDEDDARADECPEAPETPVTRRGDLWLLGRHRVLCGDATSAEDVARLMDGQKADMVFTDPPYNVDYNPDAAPTNSDKRRTKNPLGGIKSDKMSDGEFLEFIRATIRSMIASSKDGASAYVCHADTEGLNFRTAFQEAYTLSSVLIWAKNNFSIGRKDYHWMHEPILYGWPLGNTHNYYGDRSQTTIWSIAKDNVNSYVHPTQKPVALIQKAVLNSSKSGDAVLDLFGGSGSTLVACEKMHRDSRLMELDPKYCDVIVKRWQDYTGQAATLDGDGRTFAAVAEERR